MNQEKMAREIRFLKIYAGVSLLVFARNYFVSIFVDQK